MDTSNYFKKFSNPELIKIIQDFLIQVESLKKKISILESKNKNLEFILKSQDNTELENLKSQIRILSGKLENSLIESNNLKQENSQLRKIKPPENFNNLIKNFGILKESERLIIERDGRIYLLNDVRHFKDRIGRLFSTGEIVSYDNSPLFNSKSLATPLRIGGLKKSYEYNTRNFNFRKNKYILNKNQKMWLSFIQDGNPEKSTEYSIYNEKYDVYTFLNGVKIYCRHGRPVMKLENNKKEKLN